MPGRIVDGSRGIRPGLYALRDVPPKDRLVEADNLEERPGVDAIVEKHDQGRSPVVSHGEGLLSAAELLRGPLLGGDGFKADRLGDDAFAFYRQLWSLECSRHGFVRTAVIRSVAH